jgi:hypothetical protein
MKLKRRSRGLCEAVATPMMTSSEVIGGNFALDWLLRREEIPFYEGRDDSPGALERTVDAITRLGERIQFPLEPNANWLRAGLKACLEPPRAALRGTLSDLAQRRLGLNFVSHLRHARLVPWGPCSRLRDHGGAFPRALRLPRRADVVCRIVPLRSSLVRRSSVPYHPLIPPKPPRSLPGVSP